MRKAVFALMAAVGLHAGTPDGPDLAYREIVRFKIESKGSTYSLASNVWVQCSPRTPRAVQDNSFSVVEQGYAKLTGLRGEANEKELAPSSIAFHYPAAQDLFIRPGKIHQVDFPKDQKPGESRSFSYQETFQDLAFLPIVTLPAVNTVERFEISVSHPTDLNVDFEFFQPSGDLHPRIDRSKPGFTTVVFQDLPKPLDAPFHPFQRLSAAVLTNITKNGKPLTPHTPAAFAHWYQGLLPADPSQDPALALWLSDELAKAPDIKEKARVLFDHVKREIRYIADEGALNAFIPHPPGEVFAKRFGDCKDKAWLLATLGRLHGLPIHLVLLSTHPEPEFGGVNVGQYNHVICALEDPAGLVFMDPTWPTSEMGILPDPDVLARALVLDPKDPRVLITPGLRPEPDIEVQVSAGLSDLKQGKATVRLRHTWSARATQALRELRPMDLENMLSNSINKVLSKVSLDHFQVVAQGHGELDLSADVDLSDFFVSTKTRVYAPSAPFRVLGSELLDRRKDSQPVDVDGPDRLRLSIVLSAPGYRARQDSVALGSDGSVQHRASCLALGESAHFTYEFNQPFRLVPSSERTALLSFQEQYLRLNSRLFILQEVQP